MSNHVAVSDLLPFFASGALSEDERAEVTAHLRECADCRSELALWHEVSGAVNDQAEALPAPGAAPLAGAMRTIRRQRINPFSFAWLLLRAQLPLVRRDLWSASALVMALGFVVALLMPNHQQAAGAIGAIAPLLAAAGVALIYGVENDPAFELSLSTPTSPRQVLLARLTLVFGYDLALALVASLALVLILPVGTFGGVVLGWLGPMTFLSALALALSLRLGTSGAVAVSMTLWLTRWFARGAFEIPAVGASASLEALSRVYNAGWANTPLLLALALTLGALAVWLVGRGEPARTAAA